MKLDLDKIAECDQRFFGAAGTEFEGDHVNTYDCFRKESKSFNEHNDCTVISFATVWGCSYEQAHTHLKMAGGRQNRHALPWAACRSVATWCPKTLIKAGPYTHKNRITLKEFCKQHPVGRYWVGVSGHALAVIDGVIYDHSYKPRRQVLMAFRVYGPKEQTLVQHS